MASRFYPIAEDLFDEACNAPGYGNEARELAIQHIIEALQDAYNDGGDDILRET